MPIDLQNHVSLKRLNTFGFDISASTYALIPSYEVFLEVLAQTRGPYFVLGGGSNICFTKDVEGIVLHNQILGMEVIRESEAHVWVRIGGGENWHQTVMEVIKKDWGGLENLSLIPGSIGAAPIQNIGAYGVELKDVFENLEAWDMSSGQKITFSKEACRFGYRDSFFKQQGKGRYFIAYVTLRLDKSPHRLHLDYGAIRETLQVMGVMNPKIADVSQAVIRIRQSKLPDPVVLGNAGSFFKNPLIPDSQFQSLKEAYHGIPGFPTEDGMVKVPAGWLIEQCDWKGKRLGPVGCHKDQALVLVHYGGGTGTDILELCKAIQADVATRFGIQLETEVNIW
jgi:UDP-N-acetylmuramate dehydrogenase